MAMREHFRQFAAYNKWANGRVYAAAEEVGEEDFRRDVGAFFGSLCGTLNHLLAGDLIWMARFTGSGDHPDQLDAVLHEKLEKLAAARNEQDNRIIEWIEEIDDRSLENEFTYRMISEPVTVTQRLGPAVSHFFNHQTHHRGQAHTILSLLGQAPPPLDLLYFHRTEAGEKFR